MLRRLHIGLQVFGINHLQRPQLGQQCSVYHQEGPTTLLSAPEKVWLRKEILVQFYWTVIDSVSIFSITSMEWQQHPEAENRKSVVNTVRLLLDVTYSLCRACRIDASHPANGLFVTLWVQEDQCLWHFLFAFRICVCLCKICICEVSGGHH